jgi:RNA methyltransferase, TrmH family
MHEPTRPQASIHQHLFPRIRRLARREVRQSEGCFWIEGVRNFVQAYDAGWRFEAVVFSEVLNRLSLVEMIVRRLKASGTPPVKVTPEQFRSISVTERASGIGAIVRLPWRKLDEAASSEIGLGWLVIERIRSPGNLGSILRTAEACDIGAVVFLGDEADPFDPAVVRAAMGGLCRLRLVRTSHERFDQVRRRLGMQVVGLTPDAPLLWTELPAELPNSRPTAIMIGEERKGLSAALKALCDLEVRLPMSGRADSLNVSVAAGVMLYELVRRRSMSAEETAP